MANCMYHLPIVSPTQQTLFVVSFFASGIASIGYMVATTLKQVADILSAGSRGRVSGATQVVQPLVASALYVAVLVWAKKVRS